MSDQARRMSLRLALLFAAVAIPVSLGQTESEPTPSIKPATSEVRLGGPRSISGFEIARVRASKPTATKGHNVGGIAGADPDCGPASNNPDCCVPGVGPGCQNEVCCNTVCNCDPFCCDVEWDALCAGAGVAGCGAALLCAQCIPGPCDPPNPNEACQTATDIGILASGKSITLAGTALCASPDCPKFSFGDGNLWMRFELLVASDVWLSYCGSVNSNNGGPWGNAWMSFAQGCPCADFANADAFAFSCPDGNVEINWGFLPAGEYYYPILFDPANDAIGDYNITISAIVCGNGVCDAPFETFSTCLEDCPLPCPNCDHDCFTTGTPGCSGRFCCEFICSIDPFCCQTAWDSTCVNYMHTTCDEFAGNDDCADAWTIGDVRQAPFTTHWASTDGPPHSACADGSADQQVNQDIWFDYTASCDGLVTVSLCGESSHNGKLAVYAGCGCTLSDVNLLGCDDDTCGLQPSVTFPATAGSCYKIRIGASDFFAGNGSLTIENASAPCGGGVCPLDIINDGTVNVLDLLALILNWGACGHPCYSTCASDLNDDGVTNVDDLLQLIGSWGDCP